MGWILTRGQGVAVEEDGIIGMSLEGLLWSDCIWAGLKLLSWSGAWR